MHISSDFVDSSAFRQPSHLVLAEESARDLRYRLELRQVAIAKARFLN